MVIWIFNRCLITYKNHRTVKMWPIVRTSSYRTNKISERNLIEKLNIKKELRSFSFFFNFKFILMLWSWEIRFFDIFFFNSYYFDCETVLWCGRWDFEWITGELIWYLFLIKIYRVGCVIDMKMMEEFHLEEIKC